MFLCPVAPPGGGSSPARVVFTVGSPPSGSTPPLASTRRKSSGESQACHGQTGNQSIWRMCPVPLEARLLLSDPPSPSGSLASTSPAGSLSGRPLQAGPFADMWDPPPSPRCSCSEVFAPTVGVGVMFEAPELPEETLMEVSGSGRWGGAASC